MDTNPSLIFQEYQKINVHKNAKPLIKGSENNLKWIVLEKIHGANLCMTCEGEKIHCCRRTDVLTDDEAFYNFQVVRDKYRDSIFKLYTAISSHKELQKIYGVEAVLERIFVYGELFGGVYPHPEIEDRGLVHVQKGVYYTSDVEFCAYDIAVKVIGGEPKFFNYDHAMELFEACGFFYSKPLHTGTLKECLDFDIKFNSTIPSLLGLPPLLHNQCEGIVIKSVEPTSMKRNNYSCRAIFKKKNERFAEINPKVEKTLYEKRRDLNAALRILPRYINENRVISLESKIGKIDISDDCALENVIKMLCDDIWVDFKEEDEAVWKSLNEEQIVRAEEELHETVRRFLLQNV